MKKTFITAAFAFVLAASAVSCDDDNNSGSNDSLLDVAEGQTSLSTFVQAVELSGLSNMFTGNQSYTVFAPTNSAFDEYLLTNGYASINAVPEAELQQLLLNHMLLGSIETSEMLTGYKKTLAVGAASTNKLSMFIDISSGTKLNGVSTVLNADLDAENGVVHIVDDVIGLPTVMTHIRANPELASLASGLAFSAASGFVNTLSGTTGAPFTVFAPTNAAFSSFFTETGNATFAAFPEAALQTSLGYHVVSNANMLQSNFSNGQSVSTSAGQNFTINLTGGGKKITDINSRVSNITTTDIQASNGVVHIIDKALLPNL